MYHKITQELLSSYRLAKYMFEFDGVEHRINVGCTDEINKMKLTRHIWTLP